MPKKSMRVWKIILTIGLVSMLMVACGSDSGGNEAGSQGSSLDENSVTLPMVVVPERDDAQTSQAATKAATEALAQFLGVTTDQIEVLSVDAITWPDSCLGIPQTEETVCAEAETPGYQIVLQSGAETYEYHTNTDGSSVGLYQP